MTALKERAVDMISPIGRIWMIARKIRRAKDHKQMVKEERWED